MTTGNARYVLPYQQNLEQQSDSQSQAIPVKRPIAAIPKIYSDHPRAVASRERRSYIRGYQKTWIANRRNEWIALNGPCAVCGAHDRLEVDHKNPEEKQMNPRALWSMSPQNPRRVAELAKCQVLCHHCHLEKTKLQLTALGRTRETVNRTGFRGVTLEKCGQFRARIYKSGKRITVGWFATARMAGKAVRDAYAATA